MVLCFYLFYQIVRVGGDDQFLVGGDDGDLDPIIDALTMQAQAEKLRESTES